MGVVTIPAVTELFAIRGLFHKLPHLTRLIIH
jgi:hypothetical protein